ncbi:2-dehydropantoate 2-reductase [Asticcacaulis biprosthecium C19]|uniref:2-dehydropantoate 2-reductase n=1 Tax=Asticcacaulis biprosthecium C19 TaxID=715226 RepID=F4QNR1_9CAUL|nr:2-dehydropantoate 2-reductase [Asticcacaulis biprosthecium]EGF90969.1 2-dehydropantoate 2-reductase [Asticcacaulis biprosthecium C19]
MSSITLIGPGAVGLTVGAALIDAGHDVTFVSRQPFPEVAVDTADGPFRRHPAKIGPAAPSDWVFVCTKAHQTASAGDAIRAGVRPGTRIAVLQNGVEHQDRVAPFAGDVAMVPVVVDVPATRRAPGEVFWHGRAGLLVQDNDDGRAFVDLFAGSFATPLAVADLTTRMWRKLCVNAASGAVLALTRQPMGVFHKPGIADLARAILAETIAVGRAAGADLPDSVMEEQMATWMSCTPEETNSMLEDIRAGRACEWDARNGVLIRKGRQFGVHTPVSHALVPLLAAL